MGNIFNRFFVDKVKMLRETTTMEPSTNPVNRLKSWLEHRNTVPNFTLKRINVKILRKILKQMKGKMSFGTDGIDSYSLKLAGPLVEEALLHLVNLSIDSGLFANQWKPQLIFPTHKKGSKNDVKNFRPVSHLIEVGKIVEYAVYYQVLEHFTSHSLFHENHHGSLAGHSTATALVQLVDMWLRASEDKKLSATLLLDQTAAYDLVDHKIFLDKLEVYNFHFTSIGWFKSYLSGRTQQVQVESKLSQQLDTFDHGVPQGSILGGLIFIIFSNDLPASCPLGDSVMYVDDDTDVVSDDNSEILSQKIQFKADCSTSWLKDNRMCVSGAKSKLLIMGTKALKASRKAEQILVKVRHGNSDLPNSALPQNSTLYSVISYRINFG